MCWSLLDEAETRVGRDEIDDAARALEQALAIPTAPNDGSSTIEKAYATALVRAAQGRWDDAIHAADTVVGIVAQRPPSAFHYVDFCAGAVLVYFDALENGAGDREGLRRTATRGCKVVRRVSRQFGNVRSRRWLLQGLLEWEYGRANEAHAAWRRAAATAKRMDMPFELARARYEIASHGGPGADRAAHLAGAATTFEQLGARRMLRRVRDAEAIG
jgi:hypothetical protein